MPVCAPESLPGFVGTVTTVVGRGSPAESAPPWSATPSEIPYLVDSPPPTGALALDPFYLLFLSRTHSKGIPVLRTHPGEPGYFCLRLQGQ